MLAPEVSRKAMATTGAVFMVSVGLCSSWITASLYSVESAGPWQAMQKKMESAAVRSGAKAVGYDKVCNTSTIGILCAGLATTKS